MMKQLTRSFFGIMVGASLLANAQNSLPDSNSVTIPVPTITIPLPKISGLIQFWSIYDSTIYANNNFRIRRAELKVSSQLSPELRYFLGVDAAKSLKEDKIK